MADPLSGGAERNDVLVEKKERPPRLNCGGEGIDGDTPSRTVGALEVCDGTMLTLTHLTREPPAVSPKSMEKEGIRAGTERHDSSRNLEVSEIITLRNTLFPHEIHVSFHLEESRALQTEEVKFANLEISRARSTMAGAGSIERHFGTWEKIELVLSSIPGAKIVPTSRPASKLKVRDFRKIHTQESLNTNKPSNQASPKPWKTIINPKNTHLFLPSFEPSPTKQPMSNPNSTRSSRPSKNTRTLKPPSHSQKPKKNDNLPTPSP